jgi:hypothetical protein
VQATGSKQLQGTHTFHVYLERPVQVQQHPSVLEEKCCVHPLDILATAPGRNIGLKSQPTAGAATAATAHGAPSLRFEDAEMRYDAAHDRCVIPDFFISFLADADSVVAGRFGLGQRGMDDGKEKGIYSSVVTYNSLLVRCFRSSRGCMNRYE